jgi:hypothetical protein
MSELSKATIAKLMAFAAANDIDLGLAPEGAEHAEDMRDTIPAVSLNRATSEIADETGRNLKRSGLFVYQERLVTVGEDGEAVEMDDKRFRTWIDGWQLNYYKRRPKKNEDDSTPGAPMKATMKRDVAAVLLASDDFRCHLPVLKKILPVRLPAWGKPNEEGFRTVRILPYGYDAETQVYTANTLIDYREDWTIKQATDYLRKLLKDFPFAEVGRSLAVQVSAMLTTYCQLLFSPRDRWPMIFFNANTPGSGKSRLAELSIYPIYGTADPLSYTEGDEFEKKLDTQALTLLSYTFLDDVSGLVKSNALNRWLTSPTWAGRIMHSQRKFTILNQTLTLLSANQATLSPDLSRRSLMVDLWSAELPEARAAKIEMTIDQEWLAAPQNRADILSALHALLVHWLGPDGEGKLYPKVIPSFENWSRMIPGIVTLAGFECPLQAPDVTDAGGKQEVEFQRLIEQAVREHNPQEGRPVPLLLPQWCAMARVCGLFHSAIGDAAGAKAILEAKPALYKPVFDENGTERQITKQDKEEQALAYMERSEATKFGNILHKFYRGQIRTVDGRRYKFADREARHSTFTLELLPEA